MRDVVCCQKGRNKVCDGPSFSTVRSEQESAHAPFPEEIKSKFHLEKRHCSLSVWFIVAITEYVNLKRRKFSYTFSYSWMWHLTRPTCGGLLKRGGHSTQAPSTTRHTCVFFFPSPVTAHSVIACPLNSHWMDFRWNWQMQSSVNSRKLWLQNSWLKWGKKGKHIAMS